MRPDLTIAGHYVRINNDIASMQGISPQSRPKYNQAYVIVVGTGTTIYYDDNDVMILVQTIIIR